MGKKAKVKVRVKKRKLKIKRIIFCLLFLCLVVSMFILAGNIPIKNIYIIGNSIVSDKKIITTSNIDNYPPILSTKKKDIINNLKNNNYIKEVKVEKKFPSKLYIYITEYKVLSIYNNKVLLNSGILVDNTYNIYNVPTLISDITNVKDKYVSSFNEINSDILLKISEVEYTPNDVDNERFTLYMNDGNLVYITLNKISKLNKYNSIYSKLDGKKGIIYLDSGDYIEVKEE